MKIATLQWAVAMTMIVPHQDDLHANYYIKKPVDLDALAAIVRMIDEFWFSIVRLPRE